MSLAVRENVALAPYTTFGVGGTARYFVAVSNSSEVIAALQLAAEKKVPFFVLGGGSNILVNDEGFAGLVIHNGIKGFTYIEQKGSVLVSAGAGESWDGVVERCISRGWAGIEGLSGVPGTVGAAPVQNIGCYGQSFSEVAHQIKAIDTVTKTERVFSAAECAFRYRDSRFKSDEPGRYIITQVTMRLRPGGVPTTHYQDHRYSIAKTLEDKKLEPTLAHVRAVVLEIRARKGMVIRPEFESYQSAGSFFKALMVPVTTYEHIRRVALEQDAKKTEQLEPWHWPAGGVVKIAPAFLLEFTPYRRGYVQGAVGVSPKHSLAIINRGGAQAQEIMELARTMQQSVQDIFGVTLEPEVQLVGFSRNVLVEHLNKKR